MLAKLKSAVASPSWWIAGPGASALALFACWALTKDFGTAIWALIAGGSVSVAMALRD
jgi:hypothetical protein